MRRQKCSQCGTMLDISALEKGSKFACANCGTILVVGEAATVKRSFKDSGPAFERKSAKQSKAGAPAKSRAKSKAAGEAPPKRSRRRGAEATSAPPSKSKLPLFVGIGVVAVIAVVVVIVTAGGSGGSGGGTGGGSTGETPQQWWAKRGPQLYEADVETLRSWLKQAKERGYEEMPAFWPAKEDRIYKAILRKAPDDREANLREGRVALQDYPDFQGVWDSMNDNFRLLPDEMKDFLDQYVAVADGKPLWISRQKYASAKKTLDAYVLWRKKLEENPAAEKIDRVQSQARTILGDKVDFLAKVEGPFILLLVYPKGEGEEAMRETLARQGGQYAKALRRFYAEFEKRFRKPLNLAPIEEGTYYTHVILGRHDDLRKFVQGEGFDTGSDLPGYFSLRTKWSHVLARPTKQEGEDEAQFKKERLDIGGDLAHEAAHQLQWHFSKDPKHKLLNYLQEWNGIWLTEGFAEYLGGGVRLDPESGSVEFDKPTRRVAFLKEMRDNGVPHLQLRELVQLDSLEAFGRYKAGTWVPLLVQDEDMPETAGQWLMGQPAVKALYAQAWFLTYFLNEFEDGKYKEKYGDLLMTALRGRRKPEKYRKDKTVEERWNSPTAAFEEIFELKDAAAWKSLQREHDRFLKRAIQ